MKVITRPEALATARTRLASSGFACGEHAESAADISLEDLADIKVISASPKLRNLPQIPAAAFVIRRDDIARAGARSLADVPAMAPGIEAARIGNNRRAVATGGNNDLNRHAQGARYVRHDAGRKQRHRRQGQPHCPPWHLPAQKAATRVATRRGRSTAVPVTLGGGGRATDWGEDAMTNLRSDWLLSSGNRLSLNGKTNRCRNIDTYNVATPLAASHVAPLDSFALSSGGYPQGRYESPPDHGSAIAFHAYLTQRILDVHRVFRDERKTHDLDFQYHFVPRDVHDAMLGARLDHIAFSGIDPQPTTPFLWTPNAEQTVRGVLSHAAGTPWQAEMDIATPPLAWPSLRSPVPMLVTYGSSANTAQESEKMDALELGYLPDQMSSSSVEIGRGVYLHAEFRC